MWVLTPRQEGWKVNSFCLAHGMLCAVKSVKPQEPIVNKLKADQKEFEKAHLTPLAV